MTPAYWVELLRELMALAMEQNLRLQTRPTGNLYR